MKTKHEKIVEVLKREIPVGGIFKDSVWDLLLEEIATTILEQLEPEGEVEQSKLPDGIEFDYKFAQSIQPKDDARQRYESAKKYWCSCTAPVTSHQFDSDLINTLKIAAGLEEGDNR